jgi:hypothetical protein
MTQSSGGRQGGERKYMLRPKASIEPYAEPVLKAQPKGPPSGRQARSVLRPPHITRGQLLRVTLLVLVGVASFDFPKLAGAQATSIKLAQNE